MKILIKCALPGKTIFRLPCWEFSALIIIQKVAVLAANQTVVSAIFFADFLAYPPMGEGRNMLLQKRKWIALIIFGVYVALHAYLIQTKLQTYSGISPVSGENGGIQIKKIMQSDGWGRFTDLAPGDVILKIDDEKVKKEAIFLLRQKLLSAEKLTVIKDGQIREYRAADISFHENNMITEMFIPGFFSILVLLLSLIIYQKRTISAYYLIAFMMMAALALFASNGSGRGLLGPALVFTLSFQAGALFIVCFLHSLFWEKRMIARKSSILLKLNILLCVAVIILNILEDTFFPELPFFLADGLMLVYFILNVFNSIALIFYFYIKRRNTRHQPLLKWLLVIQMVAYGPFILLYAIPHLFGVELIPDDFATLSVYALPFGYAYLVITKQLLDINFILGRIRYYSLLSLMPTLLISVFVVAIANQEQNGFRLFGQIFFLIFALNILFLFAKEKIDFQFRHYLFQDRTNMAQRFEQFTKGLSSIMKQDELEQYLTKEIVSALDPGTISLIEYQPEQGAFHVKTMYGDEKLFSLEKQMKWMMQHETGELLSYKGRLGIRLYQNGGKKTYLWIGLKRNGTSFNLSEKSWLIGIVKYVRLVFENLFAINALIASIEERRLATEPQSVSLSRFLFQLAEKERRRLASDLHDSALQDQIVWYRKLENLLQNGRNLPQQTRKELMKIKNGMLDVIKQIRNTCNELRPNLLSEAGLTRSLQELFTQFQERAKFRLYYDIEPIAEEFGDYNKSLTIYRILQELLNNADKHSEASKVSIHIWEENQMICIDYRDNGIGFDPAEIRNLTGHMGIAGLKERIFSLNGKIDFVTGKGKGLQVHITIPR